MKKKNLKAGMAVMALAAVLSGCSPHYHIASVERTRLLVDNRYDGRIPKQADDFISSYKGRVDSIMSPVVGKAARYMAAFEPESPLSNLLPDILMWAGKSYGEKPDFAVYNIGGMRAAFAEGDVTVGDVLDVAPFENKICFVTLTGGKVMELFGQITANGGEGVSREVRMRITEDGRLQSASVGGKDIDPAAEYRIATIDFVAQGNDNMDAFKSGTDVNSPREERNNVRYVIMDYFREKAAQGLAVDSKVEGRIVME